jgi:hypothetical protein
MTRTWRGARLSTVTLALVLNAACGAESSPWEVQRLGARVGSWVPDSAATLLLASYSGFPSEMHLVVTDSVTWRGLWAQAWLWHSAPPPLPNIDFTSDRVLAVGVGARSGGSRVAIDSIVSYQFGAIAYSTDTEPGGSCGVPAVETAPIHFVRAPGRLVVSLWRDQIVIHQCR